MAADLDMVKAAAVAILAMISAVVDVTANVSVSFHNKNASFLFCLYF